MNELGNNTSFKSSDKRFQDHKLVNELGITIRALKAAIKGLKDHSLEDTLELQLELKAGKKVLTPSSC